jgi:cell division protein FtsN
MKPTSGNITLGIVIGLFVGLLIAIGISLYMNNVPIPFIDKLPQRTADQDAQEAQRNQNWNPNTPLSGTSPTPITASNNMPTASVSQPSTVDPAAILSQDSPATNGTPSSAALSSPVSAAPQVNKTEITGLFVQAGAFWRPEDAEQQRAKLAMLGLSARIFEREQNAQTLYRVRLGPFESRDDTIPTLDRLQAAGIEASLVRVERTKTP